MMAPRAWPSLRVELPLDIDECFFHRRFLRAVQGDGGNEPVMQLFQPYIQRQIRISGHHAAGHEGQAVLFRINDAPASMLESGIDAEDAGHALKAASSVSGISKFEKTS